MVMPDLTKVKMKVAIIAIMKPNSVTGMMEKMGLAITKPKKPIVKMNLAIITMMMKLVVTERMKIQLTVMKTKEKAGVRMVATPARRATIREQKQQRESEQRN